jgi:hypothetical protein
VSAARRYTLTSVWRLDAPVARCWDVLADPGMSWPRWWPGVTATDVAPRADGLAGSSARLRFRTRVGYALRLALVVEDACARRWVRVRAAGDLVGRGFVELDAPSPTSTVIRVRWDVATTRPWMNLAAPLLGRGFAASHASVMRAGERGLGTYLAAGGPAPATGT